ncbi:MMPL family transporter [Lichenihabitans sp. Uapishka_5]|uniref:hopanoid transporter HpnN n=1 Tax=Lichenihabitans sp. Uapishka_5 TaxID=3037302 RepID=UPI0029E8282E|nr:MMPL family transporter [Lichenihabitans sp. Uapishka_5]MDX7950112.1 MMPL family transporter [Lichenihabitans sp. Uapishka_5]
MLTTIVARIVAASCRHAKLVVLLAVIASAIATYYSVTHFAIDTDSSQLISKHLPWRQHEAAYNKAFPQNNELILVVVDGVTPERAQEAAQGLVDKLSPLKSNFDFVELPSAEPFFGREGLLFKNLDEVKAAADRLDQANPLLSTLAYDPTLRGIASAVQLIATGVVRDKLSLEQAQPLLNKFATPMDEALVGKSSPFSWQSLFLDPKDYARGLRRFVLAKPKLNFDDIEPGGEATDIIRKTIGALKLDPSTGVTVRLTGEIPLNDEAFSSVREGFALNSIFVVVAVVLLLWFALKSGRLIVAVFASTLVGLLLTAGIGFWCVGALNLISIAFAVLFIGIGVDFGIQLSVRYREERFKKATLVPAIVGAGVRAGRGLSLAAAATAVGFYSFLPTDYRGVSELGIIAGNGMIIAFLTSITVLPALMVLLNPPAEGKEVGYTFLAPVDHFLETRRWWVVGTMLAIMIAGLPLLRQLSFDFNPNHLNPPNSEANATLDALRKDPLTTTNKIEVLTPSLDAANTLAADLAKLPEVDMVQTLSSFVPPDQEPKLAALKDVSESLGPELAPAKLKTAPNEQDLRDALTSAAAMLKQAAAKGTGAGADTAAHLGDTMTKLSGAQADVLTRVADTMIPPMRLLLQQIQGSLAAEPVSLDTIPPTLKREWLSPDGQARIEVTPKDLSGSNAALQQFSDAVLKIAPDATGEPVLIQQSGKTVIGAFIQAGLWALGAIAVILYIALRRISDVLVTLVPLLFAGIIAMEITVLIGLPINFANIIALPLLLGLGVAFKIYFVMAWRDGQTHLLQSSLTRAVFFSAMATAVAFGSLWSSSHPGTSSMGKLLALSLACTLIAAVFLQPALMGPPRAGAKKQEEFEEAEAERAIQKAVA